MTVSSKVRIYDLAKELKLDTKRLIEEVRREGVDVSVPSNSVSKELAEKIRNKYFPKKEAAVKRAVKVVKRAVLPEAPVVEADAEAEIHEAEPAELPPPIAAEPIEQPATTTTAPAAPAKQPVMRLVKKMAPTPATRAEAPAPVEEVAQPPVVEPPPPAIEPPAVEPVISAPEIVAPTNGAEVKVTPPPPRAPVPPPSRQVRVLRPTAAALNAGIRPG